MTKKAVETGQLIVNNNLEDHGFKSLIPIPLWESVIDQLYAGSLDAHSIGLNNVHQRLILLYGNGLHIESSEKGTDISFHIA